MREIRGIRLFRSGRHLGSFQIHRKRSENKIRPWNWFYYLSALISRLKMGRYLSDDTCVTPERLSGSEASFSPPVSASRHFLCLLLLIPAGGIRGSGASIIAPRAHRGVLSHTEIHISGSFNLGCRSLSHIYDCS